MKPAQATVDQARPLWSEFVSQTKHDLQKRLPSSASLVRILRAISPQSILGAHAMRGLKTLPNSLFSCSERRIEEQVRYLRQVASVNADMPAIEFWTTMQKYKDPSGANPMQDIAAVAMKLLFLPLSNAEAERVFSAVTLTKTDLRNRIQPRAACCNPHYEVCTTHERCHQCWISSAARYGGKSATFITDIRQLIGFTVMFDALFDCSCWVSADFKCRHRKPLQSP